MPTDHAGEGQIRGHRQIDRPRVRITTIWPSARMIRIEVSLKIVSRLPGAAKPGERIENAAPQHDDDRRPARFRGI